ncbi:hypothetical protein BH23PLA1_BH23PLA1_06810 [soil metagenome]
MAKIEDDPVFLDSRREAGVILLAWFVCMVWTVSVCYAFGYTEHPRVSGEITAWLPPMDHLDRDPETLSTPLGLGIPDWAFWGVALPWVACIGFSAWFCFGFMKDEHERAGPDPADPKPEPEPEPKDAPDPSERG